MISLVIDGVPVSPNTEDRGKCLKTKIRRRESFYMNQTNFGFTVCRH